MHQQSGNLNQIPASFARARSKPSVQLQFMLRGHRLAPMPPSEATGFRWWRTGDETVAAVLWGVVAATSSVELESYIYTSSPVGERFREALVRACGRGV